MADAPTVRRHAVAPLREGAIVAAATGALLGLALCIAAQHHAASPLPTVADRIAMAAGWMLATGVACLPGGLVLAALRLLVPVPAPRLLAVAASLLAACGWLALSGELGREGTPLADLPRAEGPSLARPALARPAPARPAATDPAAASNASAPVRPSLVLVTIDTLRSDHLGAYGYPRPTSPALDAFARQGTLFETAISQAPATLRSVASLLSGLYPHSFDEDHLERSKTGPFLSPAIPTLASHLQAGGYATGGFVSNPRLDGETGFAQGFDHYDETSGMYGEDPRGRARQVRDVVDPALAWAAGAPRPLFLWVHILDPHHPYEPERAGPWEATDDPGWQQLEAAYRARSVSETTEHLFDLAYGRAAFAAGEIDYLVGRYDAEILQTDRGFAHLREGLRGLGLSDANTVTVVAADHGEEFLDHGRLLHSHTLFDEMLRVPLIVAGPGVPEAHRIASQVRNVDLAPTLLELAGFADPGLDGASLLPLLAGRERGERTAISQRSTHYMSVRSARDKLVVRYRPYGEAWPGLAPWRSIGHMARQLLEGRRRDKVGYWRLEADPREAHEASRAHRAEARRAYSALVSEREHAPPRTPALDDRRPAELPTQLDEALRALGYAE